MTFSAEEVRREAAGLKAHGYVAGPAMLSAYADTLSKPASPAEGDGGALELPRYRAIGFDAETNCAEMVADPDGAWVHVMDIPQVHPARSGVVSDGDTMLEDLAEVVREIDADTKLVKATIAATRFVNEHHATLAQNAEDSRRLKALEQAMIDVDQWPTAARVFKARADEIMRGGE